MKNNIFNKTGIYAMLVAAALVSTSCEKELADPVVDNTPVGYVAVHNFALKTGGTRVYVNDSLLTLGGVSAVAYSGTSLGPYFGVTPGQITVGARTTTGTTNYASRTLDVARTSFTSIFTYDTLTTGGAAKMLVLSNAATIADTGTTNIRFLHFSPNAGPVNVVLTKTLDNFGLASSGTINLNNVPYIGATATPNEATLSAFTNVPSGSYRVEVFSGTTRIFPTMPATAPPVIALRDGKNYSVVARGFALPRSQASEGIGASLILHNP